MRKTVGATSAVVLAWALASACGEDEATVSDVPEAGVDGGDRDARSASDAADDAGIIDASDAAIDADDADSGCVPGVPCGPSNINRAFVTSTTHVLGALGGLAGADAICNQRAAAAGLDGTYVAWLSSSTATAASRLANASGWVRTDGKPFAKSRGDLLAGRLLYPLELDETGTRLLVPAEDRLLGTGDGSVSSTCGDWASLDGDVMAGLFTRVGRRWTQAGVKGCKTPSRLYCLGVDRDSPYTVSPVAGRKAFVSKDGSYKPDLGLAAADALCASEAASAGLAGTFRALLATSSASAISRFDAGGAPWVRLDGMPLSATAAILAAGDAIDTPVFIDVDGTAPAVGDFLWTGGGAVNVAHADTCNDWMSTAAGVMGGAGRTDDTQDWFGVALTARCEDYAAYSRVYCFQE